MAFVPDRGEVIWIDFDPQAGREQARHRPALVLSPKAYNSKTSLCVVCPITSQIKGYPFEVQIPGEGLGVVLADQVKSLDWRARKAKHKDKVSEEVLAEVIGKLSTLIS